MGRTLWLDGLRGLASVCVAIFHGAVFDSPDVFGFTYRSYWAEPPQENRRLIQLPPFRIIFSGSSMVCLFMVISGFAISIPLIKVRESAPASDFFSRLSSTATRRIFRLYLPAFLALVLSHFLFFFNAFRFSDWLDPWSGIPEPLAAPWSHIKYILWSMLYFLDISNHHQMNLRHDRLDPNVITVNLWTMPVEFRGSLTVYLMMLTLAFWRSHPRRLLLAGVAIFWFYKGQWDLFSFAAGMFLAEGHVAIDDIEADRELELPCQTPTNKISIAKSWKKLAKSTIFARARTAVFFALSIFLLCMCEGSTVPPEYQFLRVIESPQWDQAEITRRCWSSAGAVLLVYTISGSASLQRPLSSRLAQYLGRISYPLYLLHDTVYFIFKEPSRNLFWLLATGGSYPGTEKAVENALAFSVAYGGAFLVCGLIMVSASDYWERTVDKKCLEVARAFERRVTQGR